MAYPGRTLLACWLTVVLTGTAVVHRHAATATHSHGLGWATLRGNPHPLPLDHRHLVLLGIEFGPAGVPADGDTSPGTGSAAGVLAVTGAAAHDAPTDAGLPFVPLVLAPAGEPAVSALTTPPALTPSCPLVTRARSGVLRS